MQYRDQYSGVAIRTVLVPQLMSATRFSLAQDMTGFKSVVFAVQTGVFTAGTEIIGIQLQEADVLGSWSNVPAAYLQSDAPANLAPSFSYRIGYIGGKRYVRLNITWTSGTSAQVSAVALLEPMVRPVP